MNNARNPVDARLLNLRLQAERRTVQPDHDLMLWAHNEIARLRAALNKLVRKGTDGRWRTTQNGYADVTDIVEQAQDQKP